MIDYSKFIPITFKKDAYIIVEGKSNNCFFIIQTGKVQLSRDAEVVKERDGNILGPGDFFGVVSAMSSHSHIETAQALTDVTLTSIQANQIDEFIQDNVPIAMNIILQFSSRIRYLNKALTHLTLHDIEGEDEVSHLFTVGKYYDKEQCYTQAYHAYHQYVKHCPDGEYVSSAKERLEALAPYSESLTVISNGNKRTYTKDTLLYAQGEPGEELYVIQSGTVKITKIVNDNEILLSLLTAGDIFGEMAILESKPRSVNAVTHEDCTIIAISKENFTGIVGSNPQIVTHLIQSAAERIWFLYKQLANTLMIDPVSRMYDALLIQLEKNRIPLNNDDEHTFNFGLKEVVRLIGIPEEDADKSLEKIREDPNIQIVDDKIHIRQVAGLTKQADYYKTIEWRKKAFRDSPKPGKMPPYSFSPNSISPQIV